MKRFILLLPLAVLTFCATAQRMSDGVLLDTMKSVVYIQVHGFDKAFNPFSANKDVVPIIDYGQRVKAKTGAYVVGDDGKEMEFESMMGVINYLYTKGWDLIDSYALSIGNDKVYHHVMKRRE